MNSRAPDALTNNFARLPFPQWHWPGPTQYYGDENVIVELQTEEGWLYVAARDDAAFQEFDRSVTAAGMDWQARFDE